MHVLKNSWGTNFFEDRIFTRMAANSFKTIVSAASVGSPVQKPAR